MLKYTEKIRKAVKFAIKVHEIDQKQKRKGKDIAYITHPLTVALVLSQARAGEELIISGLLHDTVEDCSDQCPVTLESIKDEFGEKVVELVKSITEEEKSLPWAERKKQTRQKIKEFSDEMVLLKSADILANGNEIIDDYNEEGEKVFDRFNAPKQDKIKSQIKLIEALLNRWEDSPLASDLKELKKYFEDIGG